MSKLNLLIDNRTYQAFLASKGYYKGKIDGDFGPQTRAAALAMVGRLLTVTRSEEQALLAVTQLFFKSKNYYTGAIDGLIGPGTKDALERWQNATRNASPPIASVAHQPKIWPRQADVPSYFGKPGENLVTVVVPYKMKLAWDHSTVVTKITCHKMVSESLIRIFQKTLDHYGYEKICDLGLDLFGGCFNLRKMKGGKNLSMHSWGIAVDLDPDRNQLRWGRDRAEFSKPEYNAFWAIVEGEGWVSLGRERNYDFMHFQAARL